MSRARKPVGYMLMVTGLLLLLYLGDAYFLGSMRSEERSLYASIVLPLASVCIVVGAILYRLR